MATNHGFELLRRQEIPELNTLAEVYRHVRTGAELLSLQNDDENKVFGIVFRTPPPDSTGLPHIMEHAVLCGSVKYPVKEPFVELLKGSLNTFLNALTSPDKTSYPVASQNVKDLYNLIDVYLDAVFHPRITPHIFEQEGWHYELENVADPLAFKGVVFNEMKGAYSSPDNLLYRHSMRSLFPDTPYGLDSGGDPARIPDLTYDQFKAFHDTYYHPSNARIFFYGDDDPDERLRYLNEHLQEFDRLAVDSAIPLQPQFREPQRIVVPYDVGSESPEGQAPSDAKKSFLTVNWLLPENVDPQLTLALNILDHVLIGTPASPLRKALIDSGLGEDLTGGGLSDSLRQLYFSTGLKGIIAQDADRVETLILDTLASLVRAGIDPAMVEASLNTTEFALRENNTGSYPRGLVLMLRSMSTWLHDGDPLAPLAFEAPLQAIKERVAAGQPYFEDLTRTYLAENQHRTTLLLKPDPEIGQQQQAAEQARLAAEREAMNSDRLAQVIQNTHDLKRLQETPDPPEALATIPTLALVDLDRQNKLIPIEFIPGRPPALYHDLFTNGILYLDLAFNLHALPQELLPYIPLFGQALLKIGTEMEDFVKLSQRVGRKTGGITSTTFISAVRGQPQSTAWLLLRGKSTVPQAGDLLAILRDVLLTVKLDNRERFLQMVLEAKARYETGLIPGGHRVVHTRLGAHFDEAGWATEQVSGISALFFLRHLAEQVETNWPAVLQKLEEVRLLLINRDAILCNVTLDGENWTAIRPQLAEFSAGLPNAPVNVVSWSPQPVPPFEGLTIPARVNYVAKGANLYEAGYELDGSVSVITNYLRTTWLWERVRVQGGAYGGFCIFDRHSGVLDYLSYRDPNLLSTLDNYDRTSGFLRQLELEKEELVKTIIGAIGRIDDYQLPDAKGYTSLVRYLIQESDEDRQAFREQVLSATAEDFRAFADVLQHVSDTGQVVVMGSLESIQEANASREGFLHVTPVL
jgi:Zn-dependent M16 (insulinase) family peptidase